MKLVTYFINSPLSQRDYDRYGIQNWINRGWEVRVFDFTRFLKPKFWDHVNGEKISVDFEGLTIFEEIHFALASIEKLKTGSVLIDFIDTSNLEEEIKQVAYKRLIIIKLVLGLGHLPLRFKDIIKKLLSNPRNVVLAIINRVKRSRSIHSYFDYLVVGGVASHPEASNEKKSIIRAHHLDYDILLTNKKFDNELEGKGVLFIDQNSVYHSDYVNMGVTPWVTAEKYFSSINTGLGQISKALNSTVSIAAHPRSGYENKSFKYAFPIIKNQTLDLIKKSRVVISHGSTSLYWAIIFKKPIILVITDEYYNSPYGKRIDFMASELGKEIVLLDRIPKKYDWESQLLVDETKYQNFIENYVKQRGTPEKPLWDIVIDRIESDLFHE